MQKKHFKLFWHLKTKWRYISRKLLSELDYLHDIHTMHIEIMALLLLCVSIQTHESVSRHNYQANIFVPIAVINMGARTNARIFFKF